ncbi:MAG: hypothetical protein M3296_01360, partial [Actinomycetota bacterium]|nr:hypothetical protein [Actinomycetota bacterium]
MRVTVEHRTLRFRAPLRTSQGDLRTRDLLELEIEDADGVAGRGEAAGLAPYDGVTFAMLRAALDAYRPVLEAGDGLDGAQLLE